MAGKFGYDWKTRIKVKDIYLVPRKPAGTKTLIDGIRNGRALEEIMAFPN